MGVRERTLKLEIEIIVDSLPALLHDVTGIFCAGSRFSTLNKIYFNISTSLSEFMCEHEVEKKIEIEFAWMVARATLACKKQQIFAASFVAGRLIVCDFFFISNINIVESCRVAFCFDSANSRAQQNNPQYPKIFTNKKRILSSFFW